MKYLLLIYGDETQAANATPEEAAALMDPWWAYEGWLAEKGIKLAGEALFPTAQATTVPKYFAPNKYQTLPLLSAMSARPCGLSSVIWLRYCSTR